jgi:transposase
MMTAARCPARNDPAKSQFFLLCMAMHKRSNWLFAGSLRAGQRAAAIMSLIQSAKLNGHDPYRYLKDILERLPTHPASRIDELLPHRWQPPLPTATECYERSQNRWD